MNLVVEECVIDISWIVIVHEGFDHDSDYLPDLMIDETLSPDRELQPFPLYRFAAEFQHISLRLGIFSFETFGVVVEVMSPLELAAAVIYFLADLPHFLCRKLGIIFGEVCERTGIGVGSRFNHLSDIKASCDSFQSMDLNLRALKYFLEFHQQFIPLQDFAAVVKFLRNREQARNGIKDCVDSLVGSCSSPPFISLLQFEVITGGEKIREDKLADHLIFDCFDILLFLMLEAVVVLAIVAERHEEPDSRHCVIQLMQIGINDSLRRLQLEMQKHNHINFHDYGFKENQSPLNKENFSSAQNARILQRQSFNFQSHKEIERRSSFCSTNTHSTYKKGIQLTTTHHKNFEVYKDEDQSNPEDEIRCRAQIRKQRKNAFKSCSKPLTFKSQRTKKEGRNLFSTNPKTQEGDNEEIYVQPAIKIYPKPWNTPLKKIRSYQSCKYLNRQILTFEGKCGNEKSLIDELMPLVDEDVRKLAATQVVVKRRDYGL